jgi:hypothetical protein
VAWCAIHAGAAYACADRSLLVDRGATVVEPLAGLKLGSSLAWYGTEHYEPSEPAPAPAMAELINQLTAASTSVSPAAVLATDGCGLHSPGLYSWWVDTHGAADLSQGLGVTVLPGLSYARLAGATRAKSGRKSKNTLWGRIKTMHLGGRHEFSTFRLSLGSESYRPMSRTRSILAETNGPAGIDESALTGWMHAHLRLIAVPVADADTLGAVETEVLTDLNPPLNLDKVRRDPRRTQLSALRKKYGRKERGPSATSAG